MNWPYPLASLFSFNESRTLHFNGPFDTATVMSLVPEAVFLTDNIEQCGSGFIHSRFTLWCHTDLALEFGKIGRRVVLTFNRLACAGVIQFVSGVETARVESSEKILTLPQEKLGTTTKYLAEGLEIRNGAGKKQIERFKRDGRLQRIAPDNGLHLQVQPKRVAI